MSLSGSANPRFTGFTCVICGSGLLPVMVCDTVKDDEQNLMDVVQCVQCNQVQLSPPEYDLDFYKDDGQVKAVVANYGTQMETLFQHSMIEGRRRTERFANMGFRPDGFDIGRPLKVLDVGGGYGFFGAEFLRQHSTSHVTVLEPSADRLETGKDYLSRNGEHAPLPDMQAGLLDDDFVARHASQFDIVSMWHVLEHVPDPVALIALAGSLLTPGGVLCVEVPNIKDDLLGRSSNFRLRSFMREHITYYSPETLAAVAHRALPGAEVEVTGYQRYGIFNYMHWIANNAPQGASPDLFEGKDRWWLEASWRATREQMRTSDAIYMTVRRR